MKKLGLLTILVVLGGVAIGDPAKDSGGGGNSNIEVFLTVKPQDPQGKKKDQAPDIEATVIGAPPLDKEKFALYDQNQKPPVIIKATNLVPYLKGKETLALALVINGQEVWIGNDEIEGEDSPYRHLGILKGLKQGLQSVPFATAGPAGSKGILITYEDKANIRVPMGPLANITGESLGTQKEYYKKTGTAMVQGIDLALAQLHQVTAEQKVLVVVCDGNDTDNGNAKAQLANLKKQAAQDRIQTFAIIYKGELSDAGNVISVMIPNAQTTPSAEGIAASLTAILARMANRQYLTFPGYDDKVDLGFQWDGKEHSMVLKVDKDDADPVALTMSPLWNVPKGASLWWLWIVIPVAALLLILVLVKVFSSKEEPMPMPMPMQMAAPAPMEAPKPAGPMKTVMIGAGGDQDGFPIVGWLVPLNGNHAYQTYRLKPGATKIGTTAPSDIVVNDGFMSTDHCQITCSPAGFTLIDGGSTNGSYVNDRKVSKHDLVDNDTVTLGKTNFKFKSIN